MFKIDNSLEGDVQHVQFKTLMKYLNVEYVNKGLIIIMGFIAKDVVLFVTIVYNTVFFSVVHAFRDIISLMSNFQMLVVFCVILKDVSHARKSHNY